MNVFLCKSMNKKPSEIFEEELKRFANDYGLTIEEVKNILANMAAQQIKQTTTSRY